MITKILIQVEGEEEDVNAAYEDIKQFRANNKNSFKITEVKNED